jgi:hypothetical protein
MRNLIVAAIVSALAAAASAQAQDVGPLVRKLSELAERKGYKAPFIGQFCDVFGWYAFECQQQFTFQVSYYDHDGTAHTFNSVRIPNAPRRIVLLRHDKRFGMIFLADLDGTLQAIVRLEILAPKQFHVVRNSLQDASARKAFADEIVYWRSQQSVLEKEPDQ